MEESKEYTPGGVHKVVVSYMNGVARGTVLDAPAGQGHLSGELEKLGFALFPVDIERDNILHRTGRNVQVDLNEPLPFRDGSFDYVVSLEGIEHLEAPHSLIRGFARVLKPSGRLIVSTPNVMTIKSRLRFLFCGHFDYFRFIGPLPPEARYRHDEYDHQHINPISYTEMKFILEKSGLELEEIKTNRFVRKRGFVGHSLLKKIIRKKTAKRLPWDPFLLDDILLEGDDLIFIARKK